VGITLYELLTGAQPFTGQAVAVMRSHLDSMPSRPNGMPDRLWALVSACLSKDPGARPSAMVLARALRDPALLRESMPHGQAAPPYGGPYGESPWTAAGGRPSGAVPSMPTGSSAYPRQGGPVTASVRLPAMTPPATPAMAAMSAGLPTPPATPAAFATSTGAVPPGMASPETVAPLGMASPVTEAAFVGIGSAGQPPRPGRSTSHRGPRRLGIHPVWAVAAAFVLVFAGVGGTYLTMSGGSSGKAAGLQASPLVAVTQSLSTSPAASHRASASPTKPSAQPSATAATTTPAAAPTTAPVSATTPADIPSGAPAGTPGPTGPNLVSDGDFSNPNLSDSAWSDYVWNTVVVNGGTRGGYAAEMTGDPTAGITQIITVKPGQEYQLTGWIISDTGGNATYVGVKQYDSTKGVSHALNTTSWTETVMNFTPGPGHTTATVFCWQAIAGTGYCTDISVRAIG
jgi:hypothetical protein